MIARSRPEGGGSYWSKAPHKDESGTGLAGSFDMWAFIWAVLCNVKEPAEISLMIQKHERQAPQVPSNCKQKFQLLLYTDIGDDIM